MSADIEHAAGTQASNAATKADPEGTNTAPSAGSYDPGSGSNRNEAAPVANANQTTAVNEVIDVERVARLLHVGRNTVYALVARNVIPHRRLGKQIRFSRAAKHAMVGFVVIAGREGKAITMPVRRDPRTDGWFFRTTVKTPDGKKLRLYGTPGVPGPYQDLAATKIGVQEAEQRAIQDAFAGEAGAATPPAEKEVPTFDEWFHGRFWNEWVVGRKNKPTEVRSKQIIYRIHLKDRLGDKRLDEIGVGEIARLRADLVAVNLSGKRINNILAVLSKRSSTRPTAR